MISGTSSISRFFIENNNDYNFVSTYRNKKKIFNQEKIKWIKLNLNSRYSKYLFNFKINKIEYDIAIISIGLLSSFYTAKYKWKNINKKVMQINFFEVINLIEQLLGHKKKPERIIVFSSISANRGSFDEIYASSKAALNAWVISKNKKNDKNTKIYIISPSLVEGSSMYNSMSKENIDKHEKLRKKGLVKLYEVADVINSFITEDSSRLPDYQILD